MGLGEVWMKWMESLMFTSNVSVLVNSSPTKEFGVHCGLRQSDPFSLIFFVIVA